MTIFPLDAHAELLINGTWTDLIAARDVLHPDGIQISRGRSDEAGKVQPSSCQLSIIDPDGTYSNRNPRSAYFGQLGRNTQLRAYIGRAPSSATGGSNTGTVSHVAPSVTAGAAGLLICSWLGADTGTYTLPGGLTSRIDNNGPQCRLKVATKTVSSGATGTQTATNSGSVDYVSSSVVIYGSSPTVQQSLTGGVFGADPITVTTSSGTQAGWWLVAIQGFANDTFTEMPGAPTSGEGGWMLVADRTVAGTLKHMKVWVRQVRFTGAQTVTFPTTLVPNAGIDNAAGLLVVSGLDWFSPRFHGEVPTWPPRWNIKGNAVFTPIDGAGIMRRLGQGATPLRSPLYREFTKASNAASLVAYWPMEDGTAATQFAAASRRTPPMRITGTVQPSSFTGVPGSAALPVFGAPVSLSAAVPSYATGATYIHQVRFIPDAGLTDGTHLIDLYDTGDAFRWQVIYNTASSGSLNFQAVNSAGGVLDESGAQAWGVNGATFWMYLWIDQISAGNLDYRLAIRKIQADGTFAAEQFTNPTATLNHGRISQVVIGSAGNLSDSSVGHLAFGTTLGFAGTSPSPPFNGGSASATLGYAGETAGDRALRLGREQNVPIYVVGDPDDTAAMGPQRLDTFLNLLRDCEDADGGVLYEPRELLGLVYRTRTSMYNQAVTLGLTYTSGELVEPFEPTDDDQHIRNDVTAQRIDGSFAEYALESGPLSILDPPSGVGVYDEQITVNVAGDGQLDDIAAWRVHTLTVDAYRFPSIQVNNRRLDRDGKDTLRQAAALADIRDEITVSGLPVWLPPDQIQALIEGYTEVLGTKAWDLGFNCSPGSPWQVGVRDTDRRDSGYSTLSSSFNAGVATSMSVATPAGPLWTTSGTYMPFDIFVGGVRLTVTAISGSSSPQTFTITVTPVNGISKLIPSGTEVHVWQPAVRGL
jgi:hypothetical protein